MVRTNDHTVDRLVDRLQVEISKKYLELIWLIWLPHSLPFSCHGHLPPHTPAMEHDERKAPWTRSGVRR